MTSIYEMYGRELSNITWRSLTIMCFEPLPKNLLMVDAAETGKEAGTMIRLEGEQVPAFMSVKISPHQMGVPDMLAAAKMKDIYPKRIVLWGIQPELITLGLDLSPVLASKVEFLVEKLVDELRAWGYQI